MYIKLHGGACCGIKHIHSMATQPSAIIDAREALTGDDTSFGRRFPNGVNDAHADDYPEDFFCAAAPEETYTARLDRLLAFIKGHRGNGGIVEIVLVSSQSVWFPLLEERGFKRVTPDNGVKNYNTSNHLHVFHLYQ